MDSSTLDGPKNDGSERSSGQGQHQQLFFWGQNCCKSSTSQVSSTNQTLFRNENLMLDEVVEKNDSNSFRISKSKQFFSFFSFCENLDL